jgi:AcrR family transcriptional regulator
MATSTPYVIHALPGLTKFSGDGVLVASPRGRILDAMTATVAERGYAATSIAEVIKRARASRSTFYEQFADKEDCFLAAYQLASDHIATQIGTAAQSSQPHLADRLSQIYETYLDELARYPLAARAFHVEIRAAGAPSQEHRRAVNNQFADLLLVPGSDDDPLMRIAAIAASEEIVVREITDNGAEGLPGLAAPLTDLAMRILTPASGKGPPG